MKEKMDHKSKHQRKETEREKVLLLEKTVQELKDELLLANTESEAKDELLVKQAKVAKEAVAGWHKAESEMLTMKQQIQKLTHQNSEFEQDLTKLREERDELSFQSKNLEEKLLEANDKVSMLTIENKNLYAILDTKETIIKEMNESSDKASFTEMKIRVDATEKENSNLKYELHMAQKELEIRNKEREYNIKTAEAAYKQQMESLKRASKLESECNKLKMMLRKRLPGPGAIAKMRNELGINSNVTTETRKKSSLVEKLHVIEEENRVLKETLARKNDDNMSCVTESWATSFISELEHLKEDNNNNNNNKLDGLNPEFGFETLEDDQFMNYPIWVKDVVRVVIKKHYVMQISVKRIVEGVVDALKRTGFYKEDEKDDCKSEEEIAAPGKKLLVPENSGCCVSNVEVNDNNNHSEEVESQGSNCNNADLKANKAIDGVNDGFDKELDDKVDREIGENDDKSMIKEESNDEKEFKGSDEPEFDASDEAKISHEHESETKLESEDTKSDDDATGDGANCDDTKGENEQLETASDFAEGSKKLAECEEEMQNISKQLEALSEQKNTTNSDQKGDSVTNPKSGRTSCTLSKILAEDNSVSNEEEKSETLMDEHENGTDVAVKSVNKRQKESKGLLSRIFGGRKRREIEPEKEI